MYKWKKINGTQPDEFEETDFAWIFSKSGEISLTETWGCFEWEDFTHFMPAPDIKYPARPGVL